MKKIFLLIKNEIRLTKELYQYFGVGAIAALIEWIIFFFLFNLQINYLISVSIAFLFATGVNYYFSRIVFKSGKFSQRSEVFLVYLVSGIGLILNLIIMWLLYDYLGMFSLLAKIIGTGIVFFWNYLSRKYFVFNN